MLKPHLSHDHYIPTPMTSKILNINKTSHHEILIRFIIVMVFKDPHFTSNISSYRIQKPLEVEGNSNNLQINYTNGTTHSSLPDILATKRWATVSLPRLWQTVEPNTRKAVILRRNKKSNDQICSIQSEFGCIGPYQVFRYSQITYWCDVVVTLA